MNGWNSPYRVDESELNECGEFPYRANETELQLSMSAEDGLLCHHLSLSI